MDPFIYDAMARATAAELAKGGISLVKICGSAIKRYIDEQLLERARPQADANLAQFDAVFADVDKTNRAIHQEMGHTIPEVEKVLEDPDAAHALRSAMYSASRSSSAEMHHRLAEILSARFALETGSEKAVVMNRAIDVLNNLGRSHLRILGLLAAVYAVRPPHDAKLQELTDRINDKRHESPLHEPSRIDRSPNQSDDARKLSRVYMSAKVSELVAYEATEPIKLQDVLHLASQGCINYDPTAFRDLAVNLSRRIKPKEHWKFGYAIWDEKSLKQYPQPEGYDAFSENWESVLQHCSLAPIGVVIGLLVHDHKFQTTFLKVWQWSEMRVNDVVTHVWDGKEIDKELVDKITNSVTSHRHFRDEVRQIAERE